MRIDVFVGFVLDWVILLLRVHAIAVKHEKDVMKNNMKHAIIDNVTTIKTIQVNDTFVIAPAYK